MEATSQQVGVHDIRLDEVDVRFKCLETANYEGVLLWKVSDYARRNKMLFKAGSFQSLNRACKWVTIYGDTPCDRS